MLLHLGLVTSLHAGSCPEGISFQSFHTFFPAQRPDPTIAKFSSEVFQPSSLSADELQALLERHGSPVFRSLTAFLEAYQRLRAQEAQHAPNELVKNISRTGHQADAAALFDQISVADLQSVQGSEKLLRQFVLPILFADIGRRIELPQGRPWAVWDVGVGLGTTSDVLASVVPKDSKFVLIDRSATVAQHWEAQPPNPNRVFVRHDAVKEVFSDRAFQQALMRYPYVFIPELKSPDVVAILGSMQQWTGHVDFDRFLDHLVPHLEPHALVAMEIHYKHWSYFGRNLESVIEQSPYFQMMVARGLVPVREVRLSELGFSVFLFAHHLDVAGIYSRWSRRMYDAENERVLGATSPSPIAPWAHQH